MLKYTITIFTILICSVLALQGSHLERKEDCIEASIQEIRTLFAMSEQEISTEKPEAEVYPTILTFSEGEHATLQKEGFLGYLISSSDIAGAKLIEPSTIVEVSSKLYFHRHSLPVRLINSSDFSIFLKVTIQGHHYLVLPRDTNDKVQQMVKASACYEKSTYF